MADGHEILPEHLQLGGAGEVPEGAHAKFAVDLPDGPCTLADAREQFETQFIAAVLRQHDGNRARAAAALGISVRSLYRAIEKET
jgi:transcriptional regulator with PAS, ATPase and Fis domain